MWKPVVTILAVIFVFIAVNAVAAIISSSKQPDYMGDGEVAMWNTGDAERAVIVEDNREALLARENDKKCTVGDCSFHI